MRIINAAILPLVINRNFIIDLVLTGADLLIQVGILPLRELVCSPLLIRVHRVIILRL